MKKITITTFAVLLSVIFTSQTVFAQDVTLDISADTSTEVADTSVETTSEIVVEVEADQSDENQAVDTSTQTSSDTQGGLMIDATTDGLDSSVELQVVADTPQVVPIMAETTTETSQDQAILNAGETINIQPVSFTVKSSSDASANVQSVSEVNSESDVKSFAAHAIKTNEVVSKVVVKNSNQVGVTHKQAAKLFGVIKASMQITTTVEADQSGSFMVKNSYPWWGFLAAKDVSIDNDIMVYLEQNISATAGLSAKAQAQVIDIVATSANAWAQAQADIAAEAKLQAKVESGEEL